MDLNYSAVLSCTIRNMSDDKWQLLCDSEATIPLGLKSASVPTEKGKYFLLVSAPHQYGLVSSLLLKRIYKSKFSDFLKFWMLATNLCKKA
jgi:hypothetical protein